MKAVGKLTVARTYPRAFDVRNRAFFKASMFTGTAVKRATKTKLRVSARDRFDRGNLQLHATGGTKRARSGRIAIPSRFTKATRGARGVRKALLPRAVIDSPKGFIDRDGPRDAIYQLYGRGGSKVRLLYVPQPRAWIRKRFRLYEYAQRITRLVSSKLFRKNFSQASRAARRLIAMAPSYIRQGQLACRLLNSSHQNVSYNANCDSDFRNLGKQLS